MAVEDAEHAKSPTPQVLNARDPPDYQPMSRARVANLSPFPPHAYRYPSARLTQGPAALVYVLEPL